MEEKRPFTDEELVELAIPMMEETIIANYKKQADTYLNILPTSVKSALLDAKVTGLREDTDVEVAFAYEVYKNYRQNSGERIPSYSSNLKNERKQVLNVCVFICTHTLYYQTYSTWEVYIIAVM